MSDSTPHIPLQQLLFFNVGTIEMVGKQTSEYLVSSDLADAWLAALVPPRLTLLPHATPHAWPTLAASIA
jgi:hypothetical protein